MVQPDLSIRENKDMKKIDTSFDFQAEARGANGKERDSDKYSPTLQEYHRILWSKPLPNGALFELTKVSGNRLYHNSDLGEFYLSSDRAVPSFASWKKMKHIIEALPVERLKEFIELANTIGGIVIWPSNMVDGLPTINGARGFNRLIADRLDLTIECVRRYYLDEPSPLSDTFARYDDFFVLFFDFKGFIDFFLLQDFVSEDYSSVRIAPPFDSFVSSPIPKSVEEYIEYMDFSAKLVRQRNKRVDEICG